MSHWADQLPPLRGPIKRDAPMAGFTWFRVGGPAELLFRPADAEDLAQFLAAVPDDVPMTVVGVGSNLLVRDGGVPGVVLRLGGAFASVEVSGNRILAGSGALGATVADTAHDAGLAGLEFLSGIPGTVGGALRMNAGAYGSDMSGVTTAVLALDRHGTRHTLTHAEIGFDYRRVAVPESWIFLSAVLDGRPDDRRAIEGRMTAIKTQREASQPVKQRTGGSTFANPPGLKAWELIDRAGCRGLVKGGAMVSDKHCNFLINTGDATAADIEDLGEEVRARVLAESGVSLEWEIRRIGERT